MKIAQQHGSELMQIVQQHGPEIMQTMQQHPELIQLAQQHGLMIAQTFAPHLLEKYSNLDDQQKQQMINMMLIAQKHSSGLKEAITPNKNLSFIKSYEQPLLKDEHENIDKIIGPYFSHCINDYNKIGFIGQENQGEEGYIEIIRDVVEIGEIRNVKRIGMLKNIGKIGALNNIGHIDQMENVSLDGTKITNVVHSTNGVVFGSGEINKVIGWGEYELDSREIERELGNGTTYKSNHPEAIANDILHSNKYTKPSIRAANELYDAVIKYIKHKSGLKFISPIYIGYRHLLHSDNLDFLLEDAQTILQMFGLELKNPNLDELPLIEKKDTIKEQEKTTRAYIIAFENQQIVVAKYLIKVKELIQKKQSQN